MFAYARVANPRRDRTILLAALGAAVGVAWVALVAWEASPWGRFLHHEGATLAGGAAAPLALEAALFAIGWLLMIVAMMLPTSVPLVATFSALVRSRPRRTTLVGLVVVGYVVAWSAFGLLAWLLDRLVHAAVEATPWLAAHPQLIVGATLLVAGAWQFSALKYRCLDECRSPLGFVVERWHGERPRREAIALGVAHGLFCIGCCWSLMLLMFGLGLGSLLWMLGLGAVMAIEKNAPWGRRLGRPLGVALVVAAVAAVAL
jgi:predicted metal-binding membrane protein